MAISHFWTALAGALRRCYAFMWLCHTALVTPSTASPQHHQKRDIDNFRIPKNNNHVPTPEHRSRRKTPVGRGGTMTESSNYDGSPPQPPAYGVWKKIGARQFEARYEVLLTRSAKPLEEIAKGGGWLPDGHGVLAEEISLSADGKTFTSRVRWDMFDRAGKAVESGVEGTSEGRRMGF